MHCIFVWTKENHLYHFRPALYLTDINKWTHACMKKTIVDLQDLYLRTPALQDTKYIICWIMKSVFKKKKRKKTCKYFFEANESLNFSSTSLLSATVPYLRTTPSGYLYEFKKSISLKLYRWQEMVAVSVSPLNKTVWIIIIRGRAAYAARTLL